MGCCQFVSGDDSATQPWLLFSESLVPRETGCATPPESSREIWLCFCKLDCELDTVVCLSTAWEKGRFHFIQKAEERPSGHLEPSLSPGASLTSFSLLAKGQVSFPFHSRWSWASALPGEQQGGEPKRATGEGMLPASSRAEAFSKLPPSSLTKATQELWKGAQCVFMPPLRKATAPSSPWVAREPASHLAISCQCTGLTA